jgi:hypothetical protein
MFGAYKPSVMTQARQILIEEAISRFEVFAI